MEYLSLEYWNDYKLEDRPVYGIPDYRLMRLLEEAAIVVEKNKRLKEALDSNNMNLKEIKDAARQAFKDQQLQDTEGGVPDAVSFCVGFLAGARHRQDEIDKLSEGLDHYIEEASIYANASKQHFKEVQKLKREIEILRQYGNKDCTAMADEVLENE